MADIEARAVFEDMCVIDVDTHLSEPHDLWVKRAPAAWRERVPQTRMVDGQKYWFIDGDKLMRVANPASIVRSTGEAVKGVEAFTMTIDDIHPGCYSAKERLEVMDEAGIHAQIIYPNLLGFGGQRTFAWPADLRELCVRIYNDAMAEMQAESGNRLFPMALIPWWDMDASVKEIERCHAMGLRGINTNADPQSCGLPDLGLEHWHPLWEVCSDLNLPINFHIGASDETLDWFGGFPWPSQTENRKLALGSAMMYLTNAKVFSNIIYSGILERFPKLNFVSVESGIGWIPFILEALDHQANSTPDREWDHLSMKPSDYFRRQIYACFWFEREHFDTTIEQLGADNVMFETDFPHPTCLYPNPLEHLAGAMSELPLETRRKVMGLNAARLYNIPLPN